MFIHLFRATRLSRLPWPVQPMPNWLRFLIAFATLLGAGFVGTLALIGALGAVWGAGAVLALILGAIVAPNSLD